MLNKGFSILEVMTAVSVVSALGLAIYKLQLIELSSSQQVLTKQYMIRSANNLANQIYAHLPYTCIGAGLSTLNRNGAREPSSSCSGGVNQTGGFMFNETWYSDDTSTPSVDCSISSGQANCSDVNYANYILYAWKHSFSSLPVQSVYGVVCIDNNNFARNIPTALSTNCDSTGQNLVIKMLWQDHPSGNESTTLGASNYFILKVPLR